MQGVTKLTVARDNVFHDSFSAVMAFPVRSNGICEGLKVRLSVFCRRHDNEACFSFLISVPTVCHVFGRAGP